MSRLFTIHTKHQRRFKQSIIRNKFGNPSAIMLSEDETKMLNENGSYFLYENSIADIKIHTKSRIINRVSKANNFGVTSLVTLPSNAMLNENGAPMYGQGGAYMLMEENDSTTIEDGLQFTGDDLTFSGDNLTFGN